MAALIYGLCAVTALVCAFLLLAAYRRGRYRLLLWAGIAFCGLTASNLLLVVDKLVIPTTDLSVWRYGVSLVSFLILLYGLIWDSDS